MSASTALQVCLSTRRKARQTPAPVTTKRLKRTAARAMMLTFALAARSASAQEEGVESETTPTASEEIVRGLSWDIMAGGIPASGSIGHAEVGFSGLPRVSYHYTLVPEMSLGGLVAFDYGTWVPKGVFRPSIVLAVPVRYSLYRDESMSIALRADPGLVFGFEPSLFAFQLPISGVIGWQVEDRFVIGGGLDFPILIGSQNGFDPDLGTDGGFVLAMPILIGPIAEFHVTPTFAITLDAKFGPAFQTEVKPLFALKLHAGAALRF